MNDLDTIVSINKKAGATLTIKELENKLKEIFLLDNVEDANDNRLRISLGRNQVCFSTDETKELCDLVKKYNFRFSIHNSFDRLSILLYLEDSYIIL